MVCSATAPDVHRLFWLQVVSLSIPSCPAVVPGSCFLSSTTALLNIALAFGFTIFVVIFVTAPFSGELQGCRELKSASLKHCTLSLYAPDLNIKVPAGGHINPAVSFAFFLAQKISLVRGICYIIVQVRTLVMVQCSCRLQFPTQYHVLHVSI